MITKTKKNNYIKFGKTGLIFLVDKYSKKREQIYDKKNDRMTGTILRKTGNYLDRLKNVTSFGTTET